MTQLFRMSGNKREFYHDFLSINRCVYWPVCRYLEMRSSRFRFQVLSFGMRKKLELHDN